MIVQLLTHTPKPHEIVAAAAKLCYSDSTIDEIMAGKISSKTALIEKVLSLGHFSVLEHISFSFGIEGISRACSHQLVRHRLASFCLAGDTVIYRFNNGRKHLTIKELYDRSLNTQLVSRNKLLNLRSVTEDKIIVPNKMVSVVKSGVKDVFEMKTSLGYTIKASKDHRFFNADGEIRLKDITPGDFVYVNGQELYKDKDWFTRQYTNGLNTRQIADLCGIAPSTARKWKRVHGIASINTYKSSEAWNKGLTGDASHAFGRPTSDETRKLASESAYNRDTLPIEELTVSGARLRFSKLPKESCALCGSKYKLENHHIDKNVYNGDKTNCLTVCMQCHKLIHKGAVVKKIILDQVVSIKAAGVEETYDLEMEKPYHNFIANGFMVHNSQQSQRYVAMQGDIAVGKPSCLTEHPKLSERYDCTVDTIKELYQDMLLAGIPAEDARSILPNATETKLVVTMNARELRHFFSLRCCNRAQTEIREMAKKMLLLCRDAAPLLFADSGPSCLRGTCPEGKMCCGKMKEVREEYTL